MATPVQQAQSKVIISAETPVASKFHYANETDVARIIQTNFPEFKVKVAPFAARKIQQEYRTHLAKRHAAATVLQKHVRSYGYSEITSMIKESVQEERAAVVIQKAYKKHTEASKVEKPTVESEFKRVWSFIPKADDSVITKAEFDAFSSDLATRVYASTPSIIQQLLSIESILNIIKPQLDNQWTLSGREDLMTKEDFLFSAQVISQTDKKQEVLDLLNQFHSFDDIVLIASKYVNTALGAASKLLNRLPLELIARNIDEMAADISDYLKENSNLPHSG